MSVFSQEAFKSLQNPDTIQLRLYIILNGNKHFPTLEKLEAPNILFNFFFYFVFVTWVIFCQLNRNASNVSSCLSLWENSDTWTTQHVKWMWAMWVPSDHGYVDTLHFFMLHFFILRCSFLHIVLVNCRFRHKEKITYDLKFLLCFNGGCFNKQQVFPLLWRLAHFFVIVKMLLVSFFCQSFFFF